MASKRSSAPSGGGRATLPDLLQKRARQSISAVLSEAVRHGAVSVSIHIRGVLSTTVYFQPKPPHAATSAAEEGAGRYVSDVSNGAAVTERLLGKRGSVSLVALP